MLSFLQQLASVLLLQCVEAVESPDGEASLGPAALVVHGT